MISNVLDYKEHPDWQPSGEALKQLGPMPEFCLTGERPEFARLAFYRAWYRDMDLFLEYGRWLSSDHSDVAADQRHTREQWYKLQNAIEDLYDIEGIPQREELLAAYQRTAAVWRDCFYL